VDRLPFSIRVLLESMLRNLDGFIVTADDVSGLANWNAKAPAQEEIPFMPGRVVLQDFTGVPCVVDLAAMRDAMKKLGGDPKAINPLVPCDLVIDHSVQVDAFGSRAALTINAQKEFERNNERYEFLKWGQQSLNNFSCVPPATGIVHQVNLEYLAKGVLQRERDGAMEVFPDSCVGTDSHTTMINGLGVVGWGVGGIEAEAVMLGQPIYMLTPEVIGFSPQGPAPRGLHRDRPGPHRHADPPQEGRRGQVCRVLRRGDRGPLHPRPARRSRTWPRSTARRWASFPSTRSLWTTCASRGAMRPRSPSSRRTRRPTASSGTRPPKSPSSRMFLN
jgi:hypothetical protein